MNEALITALDRLITHDNISTLPFEDICRDLVQPTLEDLEAFHDQEAEMLRKAHQFLDDYLEGKDDLDGTTALQHVSDYIASEARAFLEASDKFAEFDARAESLGYLDEPYDIFFLTVLHYIRLIQLDVVAYRVSEELGDTDHLSADAIIDHVRLLIDNDYYALDHGLKDVREGFADLLRWNP